MKISKNKVNVKAAVEAENKIEVDEKVPVAPVEDKYAEAVDFIESAINALATNLAENEDDQIALDAMGNLAVILLDLRG